MFKRKNKFVFLTLNIKKITLKGNIQFVTFKIKILKN